MLQISITLIITVEIQVRTLSCPNLNYKNKKVCFHMGLEMQCRATLPDNMGKRVPRLVATKTKGLCKEFYYFQFTHLDESGDCC